MSVAFRRESDEEHKEPRFALPIPPGPNLVTARGAALIAARLAEIDAQVAEGGEEDAVALLRREQRYWANRHASAQIVPPAAGDEASFGMRVEYRLDGGAVQSVAIVGQDEADPASGYIAYDSPLARAVIGAGEGDRVDFAGRDEAIEIIGVRPI